MVMKLLTFMMNLVCEVIAMKVSDFLNTIDFTNIIIEGKDYFNPLVQIESVSGRESIFDEYRNRDISEIDTVVKSIWDDKIPFITLKLSDSENAEDENVSDELVVKLDNSNSFKAYSLDLDYPVISIALNDEELVRVEKIDDAPKLYVWEQGELNDEPIINQIIGELQK